MMAGEILTRTQTTFLFLLGVFAIAGLTFIGCQSELTNSIQEVEQQSFYIDGVPLYVDLPATRPPSVTAPSPEMLQNINSLAAASAGVSHKSLDKRLSSAEDSENNLPLFKFEEHMPRFPGCEDQPLTNEERKDCAQQKLMDFVDKNLHYPATAKEKGISGKVVVQFGIDRKGRVIHPEIVRDIGGGCGEEALRIIRLMQERDIRWVSDSERGENISFRRNLSIVFAAG